MYKVGFRNLVVLLLLLSACSKQKPSNIPQPPVVNKACRLTYYQTDQDLGGNGSKFGFSYDDSFHLVQVTNFQLNSYPGATTKIGGYGVDRDNGLSAIAWHFDTNIYYHKPKVTGYHIVTAYSTEDQIENYKYDNQERLIETDILTANAAEYILRLYFDYDDNDNCTAITFVSGANGTLNTYHATKFDDHPSGYKNIPNREFMFFIDRWGLLNMNIKYMFDMMSAHNILEWTNTSAAENGNPAITEKATFVYDFYTQAGYPENRTESYYFNGELKNTYHDVYSYTDCD